MCQTRTINLPWTTRYSDVTANDGVFLPVSGWMDASTVRRLRVAFEVAATTDASGIIKPGIEYANVENTPFGGLTLTGAAAQTGNGVNYPTQLSDVGASSDGKQLARLGFWFKASSAGLKAARVAGKADVES